MEQEFCMNRLDRVYDYTKLVWMFKEHEKCLFQNEKNVVMNKNSVEGKPCINRESKSLELEI